ncbi:hypothetical protein FNV43_RR08890 [Rhamnella rubrinervis]|uniref:Uncharacterized protein n=1 Tax=Rhamnella rubrinervis TaxID=2594499 RepID=A0A8K0H9M3_9ROSA|nr:hypothetical protein FNV43_RR08890 [Rhamnella rubrinervis]
MIAYDPDITHPLSETDLVSLDHQAETKDPHAWTTVKKHGDLGKQTKILEATTVVLIGLLGLPNLKPMIFLYWAAGMLGFCSVRSKSFNGYSRIIRGHYRDFNAILGAHERGQWKSSYSLFLYDFRARGGCRFAPIDTHGDFFTGSTWDHGSLFSADESQRRISPIRWDHSNSVDADENSNLRCLDSRRLGGGVQLGPVRCPGRWLSGHSSGLNSNFMVLLESASGLVDKFRPIMLGNFLFKVVSKILVDRWRGPLRIVSQSVWFHPSEKCGGHCVASIVLITLTRKFSRRSRFINGFRRLLWLFRGWQGDPLSPLLFGIAKIFGGIYLGRSPGLSPEISSRNSSSRLASFMRTACSCFARTYRNLAGIFDAMRLLLFSWVVNLDKSYIYFGSGVSPALQRFWRTWNQGSLPFIYLGVPFLKEAYSAILRPIMIGFWAVSSWKFPYRWRLSTRVYGLQMAVGFLKSLRRLKLPLDESSRLKSVSLLESVIVGPLSGEGFSMASKCENLWYDLETVSPLLDLPLIAIGDGGRRIVGCIGLMVSMFEKAMKASKHSSLQLMDYAIELVFAPRAPRLFPWFVTPPDGGLKVNLDVWVAVLPDRMEYFVTSRVSSKSATHVVNLLHVEEVVPWVYKSRWVAARFFMFPALIRVSHFGGKSVGSSSKMRVSST